MSQEPPSKPPAASRTDKFAERENALRNNLLKRKQQQRARTTTPADTTTPDTEGK